MACIENVPAVALSAAHRAISAMPGESDKLATRSVLQFRGKLHKTPIGHMPFFELALAGFTSCHAAVRRRA